MLQIFHFFSAFTLFALSWLHRELENWMLLSWTHWSLCVPSSWGCSMIVRMLLTTGEPWTPERTNNLFGIPTSQSQSELPDLCNSTLARVVFIFFCCATQFLAKQFLKTEKLALKCNSHFNVSQQNTTMTQTQKTSYFLQRGENWVKK